MILSDATAGLNRRLAFLLIVGFGSARAHSSFPGEFRAQWTVPPRGRRCW
jgi:hypothetical protein